MLKIDFVPDFQRKLLQQSFADGDTLESLADVASWREQWMEQLSAWHTPYKALIDCQNLRITAVDKSIRDSLVQMHAFFQKLFLRKVACCNATDEHQMLPFPQFSTTREAYEFLGVRQTRTGISGDLRSQVILQNHFQQQVVELGFSQEFQLDSEDKYLILKSKLSNNLAHWHTHWSLLIDCANFSIDSTYIDKFNALLNFLRRYFLQKVVGYNGKQVNYSFQVFRAKHRAALALESDDLDRAGDDAHCRRRG
ncbi:MAG: hypothetical protein OYH77_02710 [Pseudomonadota bacterium]|nr:hypothetical protein [Pseudomonadota bacterium]